MKSASQPSSEIRKAGSLAFAGIVFYCAHILQQAQARDASIQDDQIHNESQDDLDVVASQQVPMDSVDQLASNVMGDASITNIELSTVNVSDDTEMSGKDAVMVEDDDDGGSGLWLLLGGAAVVGGAIAAGDSGGGGSSTTVTREPSEDEEYPDIYLQDNYTRVADSELPVYLETDYVSTDNSFVRIKAGSDSSSGKDGVDGVSDNVLELTHTNLSDASKSSMETYELAKGSVNEIGITPSSKQLLQTAHPNAKDFFAYGMTSNDGLIAPIDDAGNHAWLVAINEDGTHKTIPVSIDEGFLAVQSAAAGEDDIIQIESIAVSQDDDGVDALGIVMTVGEVDDLGSVVKDLAVWTEITPNTEGGYVTPVLPLTGNPTVDVLAFLATIKSVDLDAEYSGQEMIVSYDRTLITAVETGDFDGDALIDGRYTMMPMDELFNEERTEIERTVSNIIDGDEGIYAIDPWSFSATLEGDAILTNYLDRDGDFYLSIASSDGASDDIIFGTGRVGEYFLTDTNYNFYNEAVAFTTPSGGSIDFATPEQLEGFGEGQYLTPTYGAEAIGSLQPDGLTYASSSLVHFQLNSFPISRDEIESDNPQDLSKVMEAVKNAGVILAFQDWDTGQTHAVQLGIDQFVAQGDIGSMMRIASDDDFGEVVAKDTMLDGTGMVSLHPNGIKAMVFAEGIALNDGPFESELLFDGGLLSHATAKDAVWAITEEEDVATLARYAIGDDNDIKQVASTDLPSGDVGEWILHPFDHDSVMARQGDVAMILRMDHNDNLIVAEELNLANMKILTKANDAGSIVTVLNESNGEVSGFSYLHEAPFVDQVGENVLDLGEQSFSSVVGIADTLDLIYLAEEGTTHLYQFMFADKAISSVEDTDGIPFSALDAVPTSFDIDRDGSHDFIAKYSDGSMAAVVNNEEYVLPVDEALTGFIVHPIFRDKEIAGVSELYSVATGNGGFAQFERHANIYEFWENLPVEVAFMELLNEHYDDPVIDLVDNSDLDFVYLLNHPAQAQALLNFSVEDLPTQLLTENGLEYPTLAEAVDWVA